MLYFKFNSPKPSLPLTLNSLFFHKIFGGEGGLLSGTKSDGAGAVSGTESDGGNLEKLSAEARNSPYSRIRVNFGVLSIR